MVDSMAMVKGKINVRTAQQMELTKFAKKSTKQANNIYKAKSL